MAAHDELRHRRSLRDPALEVEDAEDRVHKRRHEDTWLDIDTDYQRRADRLINDRFEARTEHLKRMWWVKLVAACVGVGYLTGLLDVDRFGKLIDLLAAIRP
jgi:hypothetical protein